MARYRKRLNIWEMDDAQRAALQPGQHIEAGGSPGRWCGITAAGVSVAAWRGNAKGSPLGRLGYFRHLIRYANSRKTA